MSRVTLEMSARLKTRGLVSTTGIGVSSVSSLQRRGPGFHWRLSQLRGTGTANPSGVSFCACPLVGKGTACLRVSSIVASISAANLSPFSGETRHMDNLFENVVLQRQYL